MWHLSRKRWGDAVPSTAWRSNCSTRTGGEVEQLDKQKMVVEGVMQNENGLCVSCLSRVRLQ